MLKLRRPAIRGLLILLSICSLASLSHAQFVQQGSKLSGSGVVGAAEMGYSAAVSTDGNTAIVGGPFDNGNAGAAWVFTRSGGVWTQQGAKLVGSGAVGNAEQGWSVGLSGDGNTAIVGGPLDSSNAGAAWVFTRSGGVWTQQGGKLVGSGAWQYGSQQGYSVALSADGNTAMVGAYADFGGIGAAWMFTRSGGVWTQQGGKLVGTGYTNIVVEQGISVALSADGNTAIMGGPEDDSLAGAAWVFTRSGGVWTQQGAKLSGSGAVPMTWAGQSVALSADGGTALVGGPYDNADIGAAWVFTRSGGVWTQQGSKLVGSGAATAAIQGWTVALSGDGNTALVGGRTDNAGTGAVWVFKRSGGAWTQQGSKLVGTGGPLAEQGSSVALSGDGSTAIVGGSTDNSHAGALWVFTGPPSPTGTGTGPPAAIPALSIWGMVLLGILLAAIAVRMHFPRSSAG